ncbi:MAG: sigma-70 family RNA polymerase sigma factor [Brumimicrobium sp.]|nr:sigma-70 family RNA polymerase sigma factor [Brumimicrobium sp.]
MILRILRKYKQLSDAQLVDKFQTTKDIYYAALLFERYNEMTVSLALNYLKNETDAEDATMECFELMSKDLKETEVQNFGGWYYSLVRNYLLKVNRKKGAQPHYDLIEGYHDRFEDDEGFKEIFSDERVDGEKIIQEVLLELKPLQARCIELFYLNGKSYKEITTILSISENEVKSHVQNGKRKMKILLESKNVKSIDKIS